MAALTLCAFGLVRSIRRHPCRRQLTLEARGLPPGSPSSLPGTVSETGDSDHRTEEGEHQRER
jgi:hypothetical protein